VRKIINVGTLSALIIIAFIFSAITSDVEYTVFASIGGIAATLIPFGLRWLLKWKIPTPITAIYVIFLFCAIYLGETLGFYYEVLHFDKLLHIFSGGALVLLGLYILRALSPKHININLTKPIVTAVILFCFSSTLGMVWELTEFSIDALFAANAQKYEWPRGYPLLGRAALMDTMVDFIANIAGAVPVSLAILLPERHKKGWLKILQLQSFEPGPSHPNPGFPS
jgi:hypothetical protein